MARSKYITRAGYDAMNQELYQLWKVERPSVTRSVQEAAAQGDRSENAEYIYGKKRLRAIDSRVRHLTKRLEGMTVVDRPPDDPSKVFFGAWVTVLDDHDTSHRWRLVGPDELDPSSGYISIDSPVARKLLGHRVDDEVGVIVPDGESFYTITRIEYDG